MKRFNKKENSEFDQKIIDIARVVRIVAGGRRFRFRATVAIGDKKGRVGIAIGKATDVSSAVSKAVTQAKKNLIKVPIVSGTIPHEISLKFRGAKIFLKPARPGTGIIAGGAIRSVVELAGIKDIVSKMQGSSNKTNNVQVTIMALQKLRTKEVINIERGKETKPKKEASKEEKPEKKSKEASNKKNS